MHAQCHSEAAGTPNSKARQPQGKPSASGMQQPHVHPGSQPVEPTKAVSCIRINRSAQFLPEKEVSFPAMLAPRSRAYGNARVSSLRRLGMWRSGLAIIGLSSASIPNAAPCEFLAGGGVVLRAQAAAWRKGSTWPRRTAASLRGALLPARSVTKRNSLHFGV